MMFLNEVGWLHKNLPYPLLKLWSSSDKFVSLSRKLAFGGNKHIQWYKLLNDMGKWSLYQIREFQSERLRTILEHSYKNVPYYKEMFNRENLKPSDIKCLEDLQKLPIITKDDVLANYKKFFAKNMWYKRKVYRDTSGTSGRTIRFYLDENVLAANWAAHQYFKSTLGYNMGKDVVLHIPLINPLMYLLPDNRLRFGVYSPVTKQVIFHSSFFDESTFKKYIESIKRFNIKHIEGFPSNLFALAKYLQNKNEYLDTKTSFLAGENLYGFQKKIIKRYMGCEVFNMFGSAESTILGGECYQHKGMHLSPQGIAEVKSQGLEGKGELVITNIVNHVFPLIRYTTKDVVTLSQKKCNCGSPFPRIMNVEGRTNDFIMLPNGEYLHPSEFAWFTVLIQGIKDIFFLQHKDYSLDIFVVKEKNKESDKIIKAITTRVRKISRRKIKFNIIFKSNIKRKSKKYTVVETKVLAYQTYLHTKRGT